MKEWLGLGVAGILIDNGKTDLCEVQVKSGAKMCRVSHFEADTARGEVISRL